MPCKKCNKQSIYINDIKKCPNCEHISFIPIDDAIIISNYIIKQLKERFEEYIQKFDKITIIINLFLQCDNIAQKFMKDNILDIEFLYVHIHLIRMLYMNKNFDKGNTVTNSNILTITDWQQTILEYKNNTLSFENNTHRMLKTTKYDLNNLRLRDLNKICIAHDEDYNRKIEIFRKHNIFYPKTAEVKTYKQKKHIKPTNKIKPFTSDEEIVQRLYPLISSLYIKCYQDKLYHKAFSINQEEINISPTLLIKFMPKYHSNFGQLNVSIAKDFDRDANAHFKENTEEFLKLFVISEENPSAFPLFIKVRGMVYSSIFFRQLCIYITYRIIDKDNFNNERSEEFESVTVRKHYEAQNFIYKNNCGVKNKMQIDGIAISKKIVYVIEAKQWGPRKAIKDKSYLEILDKNIKESINAIYTTVKTKKTKTGVPLLKKVQWVKENREKFNISKDAKITGVLVINQMPTRDEYNSCKVVFVNDMTDNEM